MNGYALRSMSRDGTNGTSIWSAIRWPVGFPTIVLFYWLIAKGGCGAVAPDRRIASGLSAVNQEETK